MGGEPEPVGGGGGVPAAGGGDELPTFGLLLGSDTDATVGSDPCPGF